MAKDTEKLIRQLSLISYLMAERRPVTALEIRRDVEGYSGMNEDAFARRFYADRSELESLGIQLTVDKPIDGVAEQENYSLRPENFHLPAIAFTDEELAALQFALTLLDGEFAYAEPLRLALQQISWGRPSPLHAPEQRSVALGITGSAGGHDLSQRLAKIETAIFRQQDDHLRLLHDGARRRRRRARSTPTTCSSRAGSSTCWAARTSATRCASSASRGSAARSPTRRRPSTTSSAPTDFDPRAYANRADWQFGDAIGTAEVLDLRAHRLAGRAPLRPLRRASRPARRTAAIVFSTDVRRARASSRPGCWAWASTRASSGPPELADEVAERVALPGRAPRAPSRRSPPPVPRSAAAPRRPTAAAARATARREAAIRPERFARLVTLASILIEAGRAGERLRDGGRAASACRSPRPSCARTSTCSTS